MGFCPSFTIIVLAVVHIGLFATADTQAYESPAFKEKLNEDWAFKTFATMVRNGINNNVEIPWDVLKSIKKDDTDITELAETAIKAQLPLLVPAGIGIVAAVLVPIITLVFCCCRCCCGNCGGKLTTDDIEKQGKAGLICNGFVVLIATGIIIAMASCLPTSGDRVKTTPSTVVDSLQHGAHDIPIFVASFVQESKDMVADHLNDSIEIIKYRLNHLPSVLSEPLINSTHGFITTIESDVGHIRHAMDELVKVENATSTTVDVVLMHLADLEKALNDLSTNLTTLKTQCETDGELFCDKLPEGSSDPVDIDTEPLSDMSTLITDLVGETKGVNLTGYLAMGNTTFASIPGIIRDSSDTAVQGVIETLDDVPNMVLPEVYSSLDKINDMTDKLGLDETVDDMDAQVESIDAIVQPIFDSAMKAIGGYVTLIGISALLGLVLGCLFMGKESKPNKGRTSVTGCGATCLMLSVFMAAVIILFILFLGSVFLLLGGNITITCKTIQEVTIVEHLIENEVLFNGDSLGQVVLGKDDVNISVKDFMEDGGTLFGSFDIHNMINFTDIFDPSEFVPELDEEMYDSISETIQDINVFDVAFLNDISSKLSFSSNDTADGMQSMEEEIEDFDLLELSRNMTRVAGDIPDPVYSASYKSIAKTLANVHKVTKLPLMQAIDDLESRLGDLGMAGNEIKEAISELNSTLNEMQWFIQNDAVSLMFETIEDFLARMLEVPDDFISNILHTLVADVGRCQIIGDMYDSITGSICVYFLDGFNSLWAGMYVAGLTFIFLMIANCRLGQYFRKPNARQKENNRNSNAGWNSDVAIPMDSLTNQGSRRNANNNSILFAHSSRIQRIKDYLAGARSRFSTGSQSPQLLRVKQLSDRLMAARENRERSAVYRDRLQFYQSIQPLTGSAQNAPVTELSSSGIEYAEGTLQATTSFHNQDPLIDTNKQCDCLHLNSSGAAAYPHAGFSTFKKNHENEFDLVPLPHVRDDYPLLARMKRMKKKVPPDQKQNLPTSEPSDARVSYLKQSFVGSKYKSNEFEGLMQRYDNEELVLHKCCAVSESNNRNVSEKTVVAFKDTSDCINNNNLHLAERSIADDEVCEQEPGERFDFDLETSDDKSHLLSDMAKITCALCRHTNQEMEYLNEPLQDTQNTNNNSNPGAEHETTVKMKPVDSFEAHLSDFETAYMDLSNSFRKENDDEVKGADDNRNKEDIGKMHMEETSQRNTYKVLNIKVRPYSQKAALEALHGKWWDDSNESVSPGSVAEEKAGKVCCSENFNQNAKVSHESTESTLEYEGNEKTNNIFNDTDTQKNTQTKAEKYVEKHSTSLQQLAINAFCSSPYSSHSNIRQDTGIGSSNQNKDLFYKSKLDLKTELGQLVDLADGVDQGCVKTPQSLVILSSKAIVKETSDSVISHEAAQGYVSATTEKNNNRVTYM